MKTESPPTVFYKGQEYETGNERHGEIELYLNRQFIRTVDIKDLDKKPMGRILRRALPEFNLKDEGVIWGWFYRDVGKNHCALSRWQSLNTHGVQFRVRQLQWDCIRLRKGLGELFTVDEQNAHLAKPVTKKDILDGYLRAGHYFNNFKPRV